MVPGVFWLFSLVYFLNAKGLHFGAGCLNDESATQSCTGNRKLLAISMFPKSSGGSRREQKVCHSCVNVTWSERILGEL